MTSLSASLLLAVTVSVTADAAPPAAVRAAAHQTLRRWAKPAEAELDQAARDLLAVYQQVEQQEQMSRDSQKELLVQLRSRLLSLAQQLSARQTKAARSEAAVPPRVVAPQGNDAALAQQIPGQLPGQGRQPQAANAQPYGGLQLTRDGSQELIEVIQRTIAPQSWDINGGPGAVVYWRPGMALVIRQTQANHEAIGGLVVQLNKAAP